MAVNKVEYEHRGVFLRTAQAGDIVTVDGQNAKKVLGDSNFNRTEEIAPETKDLIVNYIKDPDYVYEGEDEGDETNGDQEAEKQGVEGNPKNNKGSNASSAINTASFMFSSAVVGTMAVLTGSQNMFVDLPYSTATTALGMGSIAGALMFDPELISKFSKMSESETLTEVLDMSVTEMSEQIAALEEAEEMEAEAEATEGENAVDADGEPVVDEETPVVEELPTEEVAPEEEDSADAQISEDSEYTMDDVIATNAVAHESEIMAEDALDMYRNSRQLGEMAAINSGQLAAASVMAFVMAVRAGVDASIAYSIASSLASNPFTAAAAPAWFALAAADTASIAQFNTAGGMFAGAAATMAAKSASEFVIANKGDELSDKMNEFEPVLAEHDTLIEAEESEETEETGEGGDTADGSEGAEGTPATGGDASTGGSAPVSTMASTSSGSSNASSGGSSGGSSSSSSSSSAAA